MNLPEPTRFLSEQDEIKWHLNDAELGFSKAQHRLGRLYLESSHDLKYLYQAYKWLFISVALGNTAAEADLIEVNSCLDYEQVCEAFELAEDWFDEKFEENFDRDEGNWATELLKWRFALTLVH